MSEELKQESVEQEAQEQEQLEVSPAEQEARAQGWVPQEEFEGDAHKWVDAGEFIRRGELFKKIEQETRETKRLRREMDALKVHLKTVAETEYRRAISDLKAERKEAMVSGDLEKVADLDEQIDQTKEEARTATSNIAEVQQEAKVHPEFAQWVGRNEWYATQPHMKLFADTVGHKFAQMGMSPEEVLKKVEVEVRKEFQHKFKNPNQERPNAVEGSSARVAGKSKSDSFALSEQERVIMKTLVRGGHMTEAEYIADIKKSRGA